MAISARIRQRSARQKIKGWLGCVTAILSFVSGPISAKAQTTGYVYVATSAGNVSGYSIDDTTGSLTSVSGSPFPTGTFPLSVAVDPTNRFLYVSEIDNSGLGSISGFNIDPPTGSLAPISGSPFSTSTTFRFIAADPKGRFLYGADGAGITEYRIDAATGALTPGPRITSLGVTSLSPSPDGRFLFAASIFPGDVAGYTVDAATGNFDSVPGSPFGLPALTQEPLGIGSDPSGRLLFVTNLLFNNSFTAGRLAVYSIDTGTGSIAAVPGSPFPTGNEPVSLAVHPSGKFVYVPNESPGVATGTVSAFQVDVVTGTLASTSNSPFPAGRSPAAIAIDPSGRFAYVPNLGVCSFSAAISTGPCSASISTYTIDTTTGLLNSIGAPEIPAGAPIAIAVAKAVAPLPLAINGITPRLGGNAGTVTPRIIGQSFQQGAQVNLTAPGLHGIAGQNTSVANGFQLSTTFDLTGALPGPRRIGITNPDGTSAFADGFTVGPGGSSQLWVNVIGRTLIRSGSQERFDIIYGNNGTVDGLGVHLSLTFPNTLASKLGFANEVGVVSTATVGAQTVVTINLGRVPVGSSSSVTVTLTAGSSQSQFNIDASIRGR